MRAHKLIRRHTAAAALALAFNMQPAHAALPVIDPANLVETILMELNGLDQLVQLNAHTLQQLKDYRLQLQNLQQLPGAVRNEVKTRLQKQLLSNVRDFGRSLLNKTNTQDPNSASYYILADDIVSKTIGDVPRTLEDTATDLLRAGLSRTSSMGQDSHYDRMHYERVADDMRQVALTRKNADDRANQANAITEEMANLTDNNTVGAIQLLSAQNALGYAQNEDLIKSQTAVLKNMQDQQLRMLTESEKARKREVERLSKNKAAPKPTFINMTLE